jgi:hypothetical protein
VARDVDELQWHASAADAELQALLQRAGTSELTILRKRVPDGELRAIRSCEPPDHRWHLSVSHWKQKWGRRHPKPRYPTWEELADARYDLLPANLMVVLYMPPAEEIVAILDNTLHMWEDRSGDPTGLRALPALGPGSEADEDDACQESP